MVALDVTENGESIENENMYITRIKFHRFKTYELAISSCIKDDEIHFY